MIQKCFLKKNKKQFKLNIIYTVLILLIFLPFSYLNAQIDIKSKIDAKTYQDYSKGIDILEPLVDINDTITLFVPVNYSFSRLSQENLKSIFTDRKINDINNFYNNHCANGIFDMQYFEKELSKNLLLNKIDLKSSKSIFYQRNEDKYLFGDSPNPGDVKFETHVLKSVYINGNIVLNFLDGIFLF